MRPCHTEGGASHFVQKQTVELDVNDFECPLCQYLVWEPITTSCGHSFCKGCIIRALDHSNRCPLCRTILHISPEIGVNVMLQNIIQKAWPEQCDERRRDQEAVLSDQEVNLPLFVLDIVLFPNMRLPLHIFEPRYRLMLRRCLEGSRRFGVVPVIGTEIAKIGTTAIIDHHVRLPDGRSLVSTRGGRRFTVLDTWEQDGYKLGKVQYIDEKEPPDDPTLEANIYNVEGGQATTGQASTGQATPTGEATEEATPTGKPTPTGVEEQTEGTTRIEREIREESGQLRLQRKRRNLYRLAQEAVNIKIGSALPDIQEKFGPMPTDDATNFSFWLASLLPIPVASKQKLLESTSTCERLEEEINILNRTRSPVAPVVP